MLTGIMVTFKDNDYQSLFTEIGLLIEADTKEYWAFMSKIEFKTYLMDYLLPLAMWHVSPEYRLKKSAENIRQYLSGLVEVYYDEEIEEYHKTHSVGNYNKLYIYSGNEYRDVHEQHCGVSRTTWKSGVTTFVD